MSEFWTGTLDELAAAMELRAKVARESIGPKVSKHKADLLRERAATWENCAHLLRCARVEAKEQVS